MAATTNYGWGLPTGATSPPDTVAWIVTLGTGADASLKVVHTLANSANAAAATAQSTANAAGISASNANAAAAAAQATANAAQPKSKSVKGGQVIVTGSIYGSAYVSFGAGVFSAPPNAIVVTVGSQWDKGDGTADTVWIGDGTNMSAPTKDGFYVAGLPVGQAVRLHWLAIPAGGGL